MKKTTLFLLGLTILSCTDAKRSKVFGYGEEYSVELINCDGSTARKWISSGKVMSESNSDGYYFNDKDTGTLVEVNGTLIITKLD